VSALEKVLVTGMAISAVVAIVGVCSQGRLKHWFLVVLGATPRKIPTPFYEIPRPERDWTMLAPLKGIDPPKR
jgi:hypothetical protein